MPRRTRLAKTQRYRATAMTEMVLVSATLVLVLAWIIYFGRGMMRAQHSIVMNRYAVSYTTAHSRGTGPVVSLEYNGNRRLNDMFMAGNADTLDLHAYDGFDRSAQDELVAFAAAKSFDTGFMAESARDRFPNGRTIRSTTSHAEPVQAYQEFNGRMRHRFTRLNGDWRYADAWNIRQPPLPWEYRGGGPSMFAAIRDAYFEPLDNQLEGLANGGNSLARMMRNLYLHRPAYVGPEVRF